MSSASEGVSAACRQALIAVGALLLAGCVRAQLTPPMGEATEASPDVLRVCADPNNLPYSNARREGFENAIAALLARDLHRRVAYTWWPQRRGFVRNTLGAGKCDLVMGVPANYGLVTTTRPYYRSTYVFVTRREQGLLLQDFDDPRLRTLRLGMNVIGDDYANPPPAQALAARGIVDNVRGYPIYGDYSRPEPGRNLVDAVARGEVDVALAWGPQAGWFARREAAPLQLAPIAAAPGRAAVPMAFDIAMGVRRGDTTLRDQVQAVIDRRRDDIEAVLHRYGVPLLPAAGPALAREESP